MLYRKIDLTFWGVALYKGALKCITLNKMKKSLVHYEDNALVFPSTTPFTSDVEISFRFAREHSFPFYLKEINCYEEMWYRKIDFTFWGVTLFKRA